jgi:transcriptional regulator with XRE-family HTH domain
MTTTEELHAVTPLGERLRHLRLDADYSQADMARLLDTWPNRVSNWEHGKHRPNLEVLARYALVFEMSVSQLLDGVL